MFRFLWFVLNASRARLRLLKCLTKTFYYGKSFIQGQCFIGWLDKANFINIPLVLAVGRTQIFAQKFYPKCQISFYLYIYFKYFNETLDWKPYGNRISFVVVKLLETLWLKHWHISPFRPPPKLDNHFGMECNRIIPTSHRHSNRFLICSPYGLPFAYDPFR